MSWTRSLARASLAQAIVLLAAACKPQALPSVESAGEPGPNAGPSVVSLPGAGLFEGRRPREFAEAVVANDELELLTSRFWNASENEREAILERLEEEFYTRDLLPFLGKLVRSGNDDWVRFAIDLLAGNSSGEILPALEHCLGHQDEELRQAAVSAASQVRSGELAGFLEKAFRDGSPAVRLAFFHEQEGQSDALLLQVYEKSLAAPHHDVRESGLGELELMSNHRALDVLFDALDSPYAETREEARAVVDFLIDQEFDSAAAARAWWKANRHRFSAELVRED